MYARGWRNEAIRVKIQIMILTKRLLLRRARPDDVAAMHEALSSTLAMRYWSGPPHTHIEQTRAWIDAMISAPPEQSEDFIIEIDGYAAGKVGAYRLPEFGYILHPDFWGQGYACPSVSDQRMARNVS